MSFTPRPYQEEALAAIADAYRRGVRAALMVLPTGCGKTNVFCWLIERRHAAGDMRPTLILAHREELLQQAEARVRQIMPDLRVGIEGAERKASPGCAVVIASVQTLGRPSSSRLAWLKPGLIIIDEAHHAAAKGYGTVLDRFAGPETHVLGVTATPRRLDRLALCGTHGIFHELVYDYKIRQAIKDGYLADIRGFRVQTETDLSGVDIRQGDFAASELARKVDAPERTDAALKHWQQVVGDRQTIVFCAGVEHAHHVAEAFLARGVTAEAIDGGIERGSRARAVERFRRRETQVLSNCEVLTEGFDAPETGCVLLLRPTQSWGLYCQMVGRGTRIAPGKQDLIVIDVVDNCARHKLATVPAILDLPPGLDLQGQSLAQAADKLETLGEKAAMLQGVLPGSWSELQTLLQQVDLFAEIEPPQEVSGGKLHWLLRHGGYQLSGSDRQKARLEQVTRDGVPHWRLSFYAWNAYARSDELVERIDLGEWLETAVQEAEEVVVARWPESLVLVDRNAHWRKQPPTERQLEWLRKKGVPEPALQIMTKGEASALLDQFFSRR